MPYKDPEKRKENNKKWAKTTQGKESAKRRRLRARTATREWLYWYKWESGCVECGFSGPVCCLDLHHVEGSRKEDYRWNFGSLTLNKAKEEAEKCIVLCANCHRKSHHEQND